MQFYQEITLLPDAEISSYFLWTKVYTQVHLALADIKNQHGIDTIGVSFPEYRYRNTDGKIFAKLGNKLRVFAQSEDDLAKLNLSQWLERLTDYVHIKPINAVGDKATGFVVVRRYRHDGLEKTARRFAEFKNISLEKALTHCQTYKQADKKYPFISLFSQTNQRNYQLAIWQEQTDSPVLGKFNSYGINNQSQAVTLPHW